MVPTSWGGGNAPLLLGAGEPKPSAPGRAGISLRLLGIYVRISLNHHWKKSLLLHWLRLIPRALIQGNIILRPFRETDTSVPLFQLLWNLRERQPCKHFILSIIYLLQMDCWFSSEIISFRVLLHGVELVFLLPEDRKLCNLFNAPDRVS